MTCCVSQQLPVEEIKSQIKKLIKDVVKELIKGLKKEGVIKTNKQ